MSGDEINLSDPNEILSQLEDRIKKLREEIEYMRQIDNFENIVRIESYNVVRDIRVRKKLKEYLELVIELREALFPPDFLNALKRVCEKL
ncbi:MAG: hypothetical protein QXW83_00550 [Nitrososphaerales archaeon]